MERKIEVDKNGGITIYHKVVNENEILVFVHGVA